MNLKAGLLSLLAIAPLALGVPIQSCANQLQAFQPQVSPVDTRTTTLKLSSPHTSEVGSVRWVRCDLRASQCIALVEGHGKRYWRALWRLRSSRPPDHFEGADGFVDDSVLGRARGSLLDLSTVECYSQRRICSGIMYRTQYLVTWLAFRDTRPWLSLSADDNFTEGDLDKNAGLDDLTQGYETDENIIPESKNYLNEEEDNDGQLDYEGGNALLDGDNDAPLDPNDDRIICSRRRTLCRVYVSRQLAMSWNVRTG